MSGAGSRTGTVGAIVSYSATASKIQAVVVTASVDIAAIVGRSAKVAVTVGRAVNGCVAHYMCGFDSSFEEWTATQIEGELLSWGWTDSTLESSFVPEIEGRVSLTALDLSEGRPGRTYS